MDNRRRPVEMYGGIEGGHKEPQPSSTVLPAITQTARVGDPDITRSIPLRHPAGEECNRRDDYRAARAHHS